MVDRIKCIVVNGIHAILILPLLPGLTWCIVLQIGPDINLLVNVIIEASLISNFYFIISIDRGSIKGVDVFRIKCYISVFFP